MELVSFVITGKEEVILRIALLLENDPFKFSHILKILTQESYMFA